jgi:hypothetical protein
MNQIIYTVYHHGVEILDESSTLEDAQAFADDWWGEKHQEFRDNKERSDYVIIAAYDVEKDIVVNRIKYVVTDDGYHGDFAEHNTQRGVQ